MLAFSLQDALFMGLAVSFSSTIIGIKLLPTTALHHRHIGELVVSLLLLQDCLAILALVGLAHFTPGLGATKPLWVTVLAVSARLALPCSASRTLRIDDGIDCIVPPAMTSVPEPSAELLQRAGAVRLAAVDLGQTDDAQRAKALHAMADALAERSAAIIAAMNARG